jgi:hypothetical protein
LGGRSRCTGGSRKEERDETDRVADDPDGCPAPRITIVAYGEERPVCAERGDACWARNCRALFLVEV